MNKQNFIYGVVLTGEDIGEHHEKYIKSEYDLKDEQIKELKMACLFRIIDNITYYQFDADTILLDEKNESYYHTGEAEILNQVNNSEIVAIIDENGELEMI